MRSPLPYPCKRRTRSSSTSRSFKGTRSTWKYLSTCSETTQSNNESNSSFSHRSYNFSAEFEKFRSNLQHGVIKIIVVDKKNILGPYETLVAVKNKEESLHSEEEKPSKSNGRAKRGSSSESDRPKNKARQDSNSSRESDKPRAARGNSSAEEESKIQQRGRNERGKGTTEEEPETLPPKRKE